MLERDVIVDVIGKTFADKLEEIVIDSGYLQLTKREMIETMHCANFLAAYRLSKVLRRLNIQTVKQLYATGPYSLARAKGIGETAIYVAMCILDANGFSVTKWWGWNDNQLKFSTFRHNAIRKSRKHKQEV